jgi:hypothetical protein
MVLPRANQPRATWGTLQNDILNTLRSASWDEPGSTREHLDDLDTLRREERKAQIIERIIQKRLEKQRELERRLERERKERRQALAILGESSSQEN